MAKDNLNVDTDSLTSYANYLIGCRTSLNTLLNDLNSKMGTITNGWSDTDGQQFKTSFSRFIKEAKKISDEAYNLGIYAKGESSKYNNAVNEALRKFGDKSGE